MGMDMMMDDAEKKPEDAPEREYNHWIALPIALLAALIAGVGNFVLADIGYEEGIKTFYPQCISAAAIFFLYHFGAFLGSLFQGNNYFDPSNSAYYDEENAFDFVALLQPLLKAFLVFPIQVALLFSAVYGWYIDFNVGLVFAEYTAASIFFVSISFYAFYQQKITWLDAVGLSLIFIAIFEISIGGEYEREKEDEPETQANGEPIDHTEEHKDLAI